MQYCYRYLLNCTQLCRNRHTVVTVNTAPAPQHNFGSTGSGFAIGAEPVRLQSVLGSGSTPEASLLGPDLTILCTTVRAIFFKNLIFSYFLSTSTSRHPMLQWRLCSQKRDYTISKISSAFPSWQILKILQISIFFEFDFGLHFCT